MQTDQPTEFSGVAGRVLQGSISGGSLFSGMVLGFVLIVGNFLLFLAGAAKLAPIFTQILIALALARFAINGRFGEWSGTLFSSAGGTWADVGQVTLRYLALTCLWLIPMLLIEAIGSNAATAGQPMDPMMNPMINPMMLLASGMVRAMLLFAAVYILASTLTPPLSLVISVGSDGFGDIFVPQQWKQMFGGRLGDLFAVYVVYAGAMVMLVVLCIPLVMLAFAANAKLGFVVTGLSACLIFGVSLNLLGRLCGFFAQGDLQLGAPASHARPQPAPSTDPRPTPVVSHRPAPAGPASIPLTTTGALPVPSVTVESAPVPLAAVGARPEDPGATQAIPAEVARQALAGPEQRKPTLTDAKQRVDAALAQFATDPAGAIAVLEGLDRSYATHPLVQEALPICLLRAGQVDRAVAVARTAVGKTSERWAVKAGAKAEDPVIDTKIASPRIHPLSNR